MLLADSDLESPPVHIIRVAVAPIGGGGANTALNAFKFDINRSVIISDKHPKVEYKAQTGKVIDRSIEGGRRKTKNDRKYTVELDGQAFNGKQVIFEESLLDYTKETTAAAAVAGLPGNITSISNKGISNMRLVSNSNSSDGNDSDVYAASQGSLDTDQASEVDEGEASDAAISSEDIIGEGNANDGDLNEEELRIDNGVTRILVGPKATADDKKREELPCTSILWS